MTKSLAYCGLVTSFSDKKSWSSLVKVMTCCLMAPSHYSIQCSHTIKEILWHLFQSNVYLNTQDINPQVVFDIYTFEFLATSFRGQWVKYTWTSGAQAAIFWENYCKTSNISHTLVGNKSADNCPNCIFNLNLTPGFNGLSEDNCKRIQETFKFWDLVRLILEVLW